MKALIEVEVSDEWMAQRVEESWAQHSGHWERKPTPAEYFLGRLQDVATDELPVALYGWPVEITVAPASE